MLANTEQRLLQLAAAYLRQSLCPGNNLCRLSQGSFQAAQQRSWCSKAPDPKEISASSKDKDDVAAKYKVDGKVKRFYQQVNVKELPLESGQWGIWLDSRQLKTPAKKDFAVPSEPLAMAVGAEWEYQATARVRPFTMPLMSLCAQTLDQPLARHRVIASACQFLHTDTLLFRSSQDPLKSKQEELHDPLIEWARQHLGLKLALLSDAITVQSQAPEDLLKLQLYMEGLDDWHLTAADFLISSCKSVVIGLAAMAGQCSPMGAMDAARAEEDTQIEEWGLVEGGHDLDLASMRVRMAAPVLFLQLLKANAGYRARLQPGQDGRTPV